ncbi:MAG TPA: extracellular solute-binding protein [Gaiellaceae bacterium]|jgi:N,N'-diacetylchitobiose transport system substrate-binding protein|nr:extracellular solute-binding protein [Gaiellaceae bacterium]
MKRRIIVALCLSAVVAAAIAASTLGATKKTTASSITVWLQVDAQSGWPKVVAAANAAFAKQNPGVTVNVQYQQWNTHLQKFDATLAGNTAPDVIEMGNTEMTKYMAAGAFADLTADRSTFPNSSTWLKGLADSATYDGKLMGVPYYAGSRIVIYNKATFKQAGITSTPTTLGQFTVDGKKLMAANSSDKTFSAFYVAGQDWYSALAFVYDFGGQIASQSGGKWAGTLDKPRAIAGLTAFKNTFLSLSRASKSTDEANPFPTTPFSQGHAASFVGPGWQFGYALDPKAGNPKLKPVMGAFPMPSHVAGRTMPAFLGGSDLAIPASSSNKTLAEQWIADFTASPQEAGIVKAGNLPNTTSLLNLVKGTPGSALAQSAKSTWFVPTAKNWASVESSNVLRTMLTKILTGKQTVSQAATSASDTITKILNSGT